MQRNSLNSRFRLNASDMVLLQNAFIEDLHSQGYTISQETLTIPTTRSSFKQEMSYFVIEKDPQGQSLNYVLFPPTKDSEIKMNEANLAYIGDVIDEFKRVKDVNQYTLLMPMRQCRRFFNAPSLIDLLKKKHIVLSVFDFQNKQVAQYDAQTDFFWLKPIDHVTPIYPDKLPKIITLLERDGLPLNYKKVFLETQTDDVACGYFVTAFSQSYVINQGISQFKNIRCVFEEKPASESNNETLYLGNETLNKKYYMQQFVKTYGLEQEPESSELYSSDLNEDELKVIEGFTALGEEEPLTKEEVDGILKCRKLFESLNKQQQKHEGEGFCILDLDVTNQEIKVTSHQEAPVKTGNEGKMEDDFHLVELPTKTPPVVVASEDKSSTPPKSLWDSFTSLWSKPAPSNVNPPASQPQKKSFFGW